jgi:hypothetical protein
MKCLQNLDFEQAELAISEDEEVSTPARGIEEG